VVLACKTQSGKTLYIVLVSALNVGVMQVSFEPRIKTNADVFESQAYNFENLYLDKGSDFGCFEMGSTIVVLAEKETLECLIKAGDTVQFSQTIARLI
ncbi:MAG: phosphatidylserine decarboxylase, partial [Sulfurimonadaceae bacterium]